MKHLIAFPGRIIRNLRGDASGRAFERSLALAALLALTCGSLAADSAYKITYDSGSILGAGAEQEMKLSIDATGIVVMIGTIEVAKVPTGAVTEISYGQDVHRRIVEGIVTALFGNLVWPAWPVGALVALTKSKEHFIGLTWDDGGTKGVAAFQTDKYDYRGLLARLEGVTGKKVSTPIRLKK